LSSFSHIRANAGKIAVYATIIAVLFIIYWPVFRWLVSSWLSNEFYSHGFIVPVVSGFLIWIKRHEIRREEHAASGYFPLVLAGTLYAIYVALDIKSLGGLSFIVVIFSLVLLFFGKRSTKTILFPLLFLVFMIPFPFVQSFAYTLQQISINSSSCILELLGLPITTYGSEIHLGNTVFSIGLPCSGINTFISLLALSAVYAYIIIGSIYKRLGIFILAFPMAIIANILRISSIIIVAYNGSVETATGWYHSLSSAMFFILAFLVLVLAAWIMKLRINYELFRLK
jgi:exosortase